MEQLKKKSELFAKISLGFHIIEILIIIGIISNQTVIFEMHRTPEDMVALPFTEAFFAIIPILQIIFTIIYINVIHSANSAFSMYAIVFATGIALIDASSLIVSFIANYSIGNKGINYIASYSILTSVVNTATYLINIIAFATFFISCGLLFACKYLNTETEQ